MAIVITGASGPLGRLTAERVLELTEPGMLVLVTRHVLDLADFEDRGVTVRVGDFDDPALLEAAFAGGERLLLISTDAIGHRVHQHRNAIEAAVAAGVRAIAYTSMLNPSHSNPIAVAADHRDTEEALRSSGLDWTFLRNSTYAELLVPAAAAALAEGRLVTNAGDGRTSYVARADCAAAAAAVLTGEGHAFRAYDVTGPEALAAGQLAALYAEIGGRRVALEPVGDDELVGHLAQGDVPEDLARVLATFGIGARRGYSAAVSTAVEELTGSTPTSVRAVLEAHRAQLAGAPAG